MSTVTRTTESFRPFDGFFAAPRAFSAPRATAPAIPLDVIRHDDRIELSFDVPGVAADAIELTVEKRELTLTVARDRSLADGSDVVRSERRHGTFTRTLTLAENLDTDAMRASHDNGVLTVTIPVLAAAQPRRIPIGGAATELES
jgi:HSP20 family protein